MIEIEIIGDVAQLLRILSYVRPGIRSTIGTWIEPGSPKEVILNEFQISVRTQNLVIDVPLFCIGTDHESRNSQSVAVLVDGRRYHIVVEASPVIPR